MTLVPARDAMPTYFIPHGGGPCFFMDWTWGAKDMWVPMAAWLKGLAGDVGATPKAVVVISAHWEEDAFTVAAHPQPPLIYDYYGFPEYTYRLTYPAPGDPGLAHRIRDMLAASGLPAKMDANRGLDHGVFIPFKLVYPEAHVPIVQLSLHKELDPALHLAAGRAIAGLREEGVLIVGSGMSYHNMQGFRGGRVAKASSEEFDLWLAGAIESRSWSARAAALTDWSEAPAARACHPREEHLLPLMVAAGAAGEDPGSKSFSGEVLGVRVSAFKFGA